VACLLVLVLLLVLLLLYPEQVLACCCCYWWRGLWVQLPKGWQGTRGKAGTQAGRCCQAAAACEHTGAGCWQALLLLQVGGHRMTVLRVALQQVQGWVKTSNQATLCRGRLLERHGDEQLHMLRLG
jgi:hypothetical protein